MRPRQVLGPGCGMSGRRTHSSNHLNDAEGVMPTAVAGTFQALGDPVRTTIVDRLARSDATVGELAALFAMSFQAVSQHIGVLERAGIVSRHREGRTRRVQLEPARIEEAMSWMESRRNRLEE